MVREEEAIKNYSPGRLAPTFALSLSLSPSLCLCLRLRTCVSARPGQRGTESG